MWTGRNKPDARVPLRAPHYQMLLTKKTQQWQDDNTYNPYLSTSQASPLIDACVHAVILTDQIVIQRFAELALRYNWTGLDRGAIVQFCKMGARWAQTAEA